MNLPPPEYSKAALIAGAGVGIGYMVRLGMDHSSVMKTKEKRRIGKGLLLVAGATLLYHLLEEKSRWKMPQF